MSLSLSRSRFLKSFLFCLPSQHPQGLGEAGMFLGSSVFFAIAAAVAAARKERGLPPILAINSPATAEVIRMACEDQFTNLVWDDLHLVCECLHPFFVVLSAGTQDTCQFKSKFTNPTSRMSSCGKWRLLV